MMSKWCRVLGGVCFLTSLGLGAGDWSQWRFDAGRSASSPEVLPEKLSLVWELAFPKRVQVWDDPLNHDLMTYDRILEPIVAEGLMFMGFNDSDKVVALDIQTSAEKWRFYTDGPVRFSPVAWEGKIYVISDDGYLYCLNAKDGRLIWKFRGAPGDQKVLGNGRLISSWPARGGPVIRDGTLYFAASIWPFMGTFIYALDAARGDMIWVNDGTSAQYIKQPHNAPSFAGVAPQGALVASQEYLIVPGGRSVPAVFERETGDFKYFHLAAGGKGNGGSFVVANEQHFFAHTRLRGVRAYDLQTGDQTHFLVNEPVLDGDLLYAASDHSLRVARRTEANSRMAAAVKAKKKAETARTKASKLGDLLEVEKAEEALAKADKLITELNPVVESAEADWRDDWKGNMIKAFDSKQALVWEIEADASGDLIKAGDRLYAAGESTLTAFDLNGSEVPTMGWSLAVKGTVQRLLAADEMLFAVTLEGNILAFAGPESTASQTKHALEPIVASDAKWPIFEALLADLDSKAGYALCYGLEDPRLIEILLRETEFHVVGVDSSVERIETLRYQYDEDQSVYGKRVSLHCGDPLEFNAPPFFASLVTLDVKTLDADRREAFLDASYSSVRPYGGNLWAFGSNDELTALRSTAESMQMEQAEIDAFSFSVSRSGSDKESSVLDSILQLKREGQLPGAADWTHQYGDIANTVKSNDQRVKLPLGLLWFGGSSNTDVLPRHGHGPPEQVIGGRTIIEGMDSISARDVYTGRVMWKRTITNLDTYGIYFNESYADTPLSTAYNQKHIPGANARGSNYVATEDAVYVALEDYCEVLDAETGDTINYIRLPLKKGGAVRPRWGFIGVYEDLLLGGHDFAHFTKASGREWKKNYAPIEDLSASAGLLAYDRHSGELQWQAIPRHGFIHNGIVAGNGRIYCLDKLPESAEAKLRRRGRTNPGRYRIAAFDSETGEQLWEVTENIFGTWLGYSEGHDILLQAGAEAKDRLSDEVGTGMIAYQGKTGSVLWQDLKRQYNGPCIIHNELILTSANSYSLSAGAYHLLDGTPHWVVNPLTGKEEPWLFTRAYGCNTPVAGEHMLTFRSGAAGYFDLTGQSGTGNLGGFRSSCTSNLVIANGVLNAPDYTRTCTCGYQNQTSLALIHMPDVEMWTFSSLGSDAMNGEFVKQAGINFGAPGDRRADNGTLWLDFPSVGGESPEISIVIEGEEAQYFRHHSARFHGEGVTWVAASGIEGVNKLLVNPVFQKGKNTTPTVASGVEGATNPPGHAPSPRHYSVRLHFCEPEKIEQGDRIFHVNLQGERVLENFDVFKESGGYRRALVKEFSNVEVLDSIEIELINASETGEGPIISGLELIAE